MKGVNRLARGMAWGALLAGLDTAYMALREVSNYRHVIDDGLQLRLQQASELIVSCQQSAWAAYEKARKS